MPLRILCVLCLTFLAIPQCLAATVYVVVGADTSSVVNTDGGNVANSHVNEFDMTPMSDGVFPTIMSEAFRLAHLDSTGRPIVFTWWMLTGGWHHFATNVDAVAATRVYLESWREQSERWGDEIALHYHHFDWNGTAWVRAGTFEETLWDFEWSISQLVLDSGVMPVSFRSGWNYMDNGYQQTLERWIPFRLEGGGWMSQDVPYHPSFSNYRIPGDMRGWEVRHRYLGSLSQATIDQIFDWAEAGQDQVTCLWSHQYESGFLSPQIENAHTFLVNAAASHPGVEFRYVTAREGMRLWQGSDDVTAPSLTLTPQGPGLLIESEPDIFQIAQPWVAARLISDEYVRLNAAPEDDGQWLIDALPDGIDLLGVAVCDLMGNATIRELRDGSRRWSSQSEFTAASPEGVDPLSRGGQVTLARVASAPVVEQALSDSSLEPLQRSYWIGQTFVPSQPGLSRVSVGLRVNSESAMVRVELREVDATGFPDMSESGLLAYGVESFSGTGDLMVDLLHSGLALDGRQYALVFLRIDGEFEVLLHTAGTYAGGNLVRAYSLDWIQIPHFDCRFQTYDQTGAPDQGQATSNGDAYDHETGRFLTQTFVTTTELIGAVEVMIAEASAGDILAMQLRRTLPNGRPDFSHAALIDSAGASVVGPGPLRVQTNWDLEPPDIGAPLALTFLSPIDGADSVKLAAQSGDPYSAGTLFDTTDTVSTDTGADLWLRVLGSSFHPQGSLTWDFDSEGSTIWTGGSWEGDMDPPTTEIRARFAFAESQAGLDGVSWSGWLRSSPFVIPHPAEGRWIRAQVILATSDVSRTPTLGAFEVDHLPSGAVSPSNGLLWR